MEPFEPYNVITGPYLGIHNAVITKLAWHGMIFLGGCKFGAGQKCSGYALWGMSSLCGWADNLEDIGNSLGG